MHAVGDRVYHGDAQLILEDRGQRKRDSLERLVVRWVLLQGTVIEIDHGGAPRVKWDGWKSVMRYPDPYDLQRTPEDALDWAREQYRSAWDDLKERLDGEMEKCKW